MLGQKMLKTEFDSEKYAEMAKWCNSQEYKTIEDKGDYYEVVDCTPTQEERDAMEKQQLQQQIKEVTSELAQLQGASVCAVSVDDDTEYDIIKDGELVTLNETEMQAYYDELTDKRNDLVARYKELK